MRKIILIISLIFISSASSIYAWTDYAKDIRYIDFDGDLENEIIIESRHGAGTGHCIEDIRVFKDKYPELELIFTIKTLDSHFNSIYAVGKYYDIVSEVEFTEQTPENKGIRDIIVKSKKIYYKDKDNKIVDKEENLGTKIFKWNGESFVESGT